MPRFCLYTRTDEYTTPIVWTRHDPPRGRVLEFYALFIREGLRPVLAEERVEIRGSRKITTWYIGDLPAVTCDEPA